jgi:hypothetical protein
MAASGKRQHRGSGAKADKAASAKKRWQLMAAWRLSGVKTKQLSRRKRRRGGMALSGVAAAASAAKASIGQASANRRNVRESSKQTSAAASQLKWWQRHRAGIGEKSGTTSC